MQEIILSIVGTLGGVSLVFWKLSDRLGKVWADRLIETDKRKYQKEIEKIKKEYEVHFDGIKAVLMRYSENQFDIYRELWGSLCELKLSTDMLWTSATPENVRSFSEQLHKSRFWLEKSSLFIEDEHYQTLRHVFEDFEQFLIGKESLIELRNMPGISENELMQRTRDIVQGNSWHRDNFTHTLSSLRGYFRQHIRGQHDSA
ncbi:hypothetical protein [Microbulbifer zhoushanensis]|uniref:hypothetical protein n=1 Tax=Microbulbifer zhoushanensis TaxID=2904254 RepID=UPI001F194366|nr:hypothetical protein [Microbulbifer zhoushanensis]